MLWGGTEPLETVLNFESDAYLAIEFDKTLQDFSDAKENGAEVIVTVGEELTQAYGVTKAVYMQTFEENTGQKMYTKSILLSKTDEEWVQEFRQQDGVPITTNAGQVLVMATANGSRHPLWLNASTKSDKPSISLDDFPLN